MRVAYADPPYPGQAHKHYGSHTDYAGEVDHNALLERLCRDYDAWVLSTASTTLRHVLALPACPDDVRIGAWVKPFAVFKPNVNPGYCWEPVLFCGDRQPRDRSETTVRDWCSIPITLKRGLVGAKPEELLLLAIRSARHAAGRHARRPVSRHRRRRPRMGKVAAATMESTGMTPSPAVTLAREIR